MIISITGNPGSGKSTVAKKIAHALNYKHYYMGRLRREAARVKGLTLAEYNKYGESDPSTDFAVDDMQKKLGQKSDNFVIEGRTSWYLIPHSLKLFFSVELETGARRVFKELQDTNHRNEDQTIKTVEDVLASHKAREKSDKTRYKKYYNINCSDKNNFDFVLDTTDLNPDQVFQRTMNFIKKKLDN